MTRAERILLSGATLTLVACATAPVQVPGAAAAGNYVLDPSHASVTWSLSHAGLSQYTARFDDISGTLNFNPDAPETSSVDISIASDSVSTGLPKFDETLGSEAKYFNASVYPEIRFTSTSAKKLTETTGTVTGDLSFRGTTLPVTLQTTFNGAGKSFGHPGDTLGFSATGVIKRSDFGMDTLLNFGIGDDVTLRIEAEFNQAQ